MNYVKIDGKSLSWEEVYNLTQLTEEDFALYPHSSYDTAVKAYRELTQEDDSEE